MLVELVFISSATSTYWLKRQHKKRSLVKQLVPAKDLKASAKSTFDKQHFWHDLKTALLENERQQQHLSLNSDQTQSPASPRALNQNMWLAGSSIGLAMLATTTYQVLWPVSVGMILYLAKDVFDMWWLNVKRGYYVTVYLMTLGLIIGMIACGHLVLAAFSGLLSGLLTRIVKNAENNIQGQLTQAFAWQPGEVWVEQNGVELQIPFASLQKGDTVIINAGDVIPADGIILQGQGTINQHALTGESQPVERASGDSVFASTLLLTGRLAIQVNTDTDETLAANIAHVLNTTVSRQQLSRGQRIADRFLPVNMALSALTLQVAGPTPAVAVVWSALGSNMVILGPVSVLSYLHILSRQGILVKDGQVFESLRQIDTVVVDKTGTLTLEQPEVGRIYTLAQHDDLSVLRYAAAAEYRQPHPIAKAILAKADSLDLELPPVNEASYEMGYGIQVQTHDNHLIQIGSERFLRQQQVEMPTEVSAWQEQAQACGYSMIYVAIDQQLAGALELRPSIRPEARSIIQNLQQRGMQLYIISGDHEQPTRHLAEELGIDHYFAEVLPENKANLVKQLTDEGRSVCFIGDGINDAIALKAAKVSVSLKGASSLATDTAQIVLLDGTLKRLPALFNLSDEFENIMHTNLLSSIVPGVLNIASVGLLHTSLPVSMAIYYLGSVIGLGSAMRPLMTHQDKTA